MTVRPVIFIDADGVLAHSKTVGRSRGEGLDGWRAHAAQLDRECVARLVAIGKATGARLVVSSEWRRFDDQHEALMMVLEDEGFPRYDLPLDTTPYLPKSDPPTSRRGYEIAAWLADHPHCGPAIAIDDEQPHGITTVFIANGFTTGGMQDHHVEQAIELLGRKE